MAYRYHVAKRKGDKLAVVERINNHEEHDSPTSVREQGTVLMMRRLFGGVSRKELNAESNTDKVQIRLNSAKAAGVHELARKLFIEEYLPTSLAVLQEALHSDDLNLATKVALKIVEGLKIMDDPNKGTDMKVVEAESLESWRERRMITEGKAEKVDTAEGELKDDDT